MAARVFFSYSHDDEEQRNQIEKHLALLKRQGLIDAWHDRRILAGDRIGDVIDAEIEKANIILLLVSASFIASDYCYSREMARAMERQRRGEAIVVPIIVRNCDWHSAPFGSIKAVPRDGKAITSWANPDDAYTDVARELRALVEWSLGVDKVAAEVPTVAHAPEVSRASAHEAFPRSGNLRVKRNFSDLDKSRYLTDAFDFMARYFEGSLDELSKRNADIQGEFRRVDGVSLTAIVYRNGKRMSACAVRLNGGGALGAGITYSQDVSRTDGNSFNERVSVEVDDQSLFLRSMGMASMYSGHADREKLSHEGAAELFWGMLLGPLQ
ncbi:toll/interleukin-1 receptor domain-containing protein [Dokdonella sp. MW10]|uniref:toll/interleukin-1 receptor domain-containing protein n=1 Tax=Dokdonella sp. MW10 TaxID=2992926 RepID=UPI003F806E51